MDYDSSKSEPTYYFADVKNANHRQYLALRRFFLDRQTAEEVAREFGYTPSTVYSMARDFKKKLGETDQADPFFITSKPGRKGLDEDEKLVQLIVALRLKQFSVPEIKSILDAQSIDVSERSITSILKKEGFGKLPRRDRETRKNLAGQAAHILPLPKPRQLTREKDTFASQLVAITCLLPFMVTCGLDKAISNAPYPDEKNIGKLPVILSFLALKLAQVAHYPTDDVWCLDRGLGLFAGLNVLPKASWLSAYASQITPDMNRAFLKSLYQTWQENGLLSDTADLGFASVPAWLDAEETAAQGAAETGRTLDAQLAVLARDPDTGIVFFGDAPIRRDCRDEAVLRILDFPVGGGQAGLPLNQLFFDSRFTSYANLDKLNRANVTFVTMRQSRSNLAERIMHVPQTDWRHIQVPTAAGQGKMVKVYEEKTHIKGYTGQVRQICIAGHGQAKPTILITNASDLPATELVRKYCRCWQGDQELSEQMGCFHFNRGDSGMVVKADFDLTLTILAYNIYRLFALHMAGHAHCSVQTLFEKFIHNAGEVVITETTIEIRLKKKRNLPALLQQLYSQGPVRLSWLGERKLVFSAAATT